MQRLPASVLTASARCRVCETLGGAQPREAEGFASAPSERTDSVLLLLQTPVTSTPYTFAICTANVPTPPPGTDDQNPLARLDFPWSRTACKPHRFEAGSRFDSNLCGVSLTAKEGAALRTCRACECRAYQVRGEEGQCHM